MPNFAIPLLYRNQCLKSHQIVQIITDPMLVTGGEKGEIVTWSQNLQPNVIMYPNLDGSSGSVLLMKVIRVPFLCILDRVESVLMTLHADQRIRLWDLRDGRCIQVSPHKIFETEVHFACALQPNRCRFIVFGGSGKLMLLDLWKMKVVKYYEVPDVSFRSLCKYDNSTLLSLDSQGQVHHLDVSAFNSDTFLDYFSWKADGQRSLDLLKNSEIDLSSRTTIQQASSKKLLRSNYLEEHKLLILVFTNQISLLFMEDHYHLIIQFSRPGKKFSNVFMHEGETKLLLISTRQGNLTALRWDDVTKLLGILKTHRDFQFSYKDVLYQKLNTSTALIQLNFPMALKSTVEKPKGKLTQLISLNNSFTQSRLFQYRDHKLQSYQTEEVINQFLEGIQILTKSSQQNVQLQGTDFYFYSQKGLCFLEPKEQVSFDPKSELTFDLTPPECTIHFLLNGLFTDLFKKEYRLEELVKDSTVTSSLIHKNTYFIGCDDGYVYGLPMMFCQRRCYQIYKGRVDTCGIVFMKAKEDYLYVQSSRGKFVSLNFSASLQKKTDANPISQQKSQKKFEEISLLLNKPLEVCLQATAKDIIQVHQVSVQIDEEEGDVAQIKDKDHSKQLMGLILENNGVIILQSQTGLIDARLNGIRQDIQIVCVYLEPRLQNYLTFCDDGSIYVHNTRGRMERILSAETHHYLLNLEDKINKLKKQIPYHVLSEFKLEYQKNISHEHSLLEYAIRGAFIERTTAMPSLYETYGPLGDLDLNMNKCAQLIKLTFKRQKQTGIIPVAFGDVEWWDIEHHEQGATQDRLVAQLFPWGVDSTLDAHLENLLNGNKPVFNSTLGVPGIGYSVSFVLSSRWSASEYLTCLQCMAIMHHYINLSTRDNALMTSLMFQTVELFTKKKRLVDPNFKSMNLCQLAAFTIDNSNEIMTSACNLIISQIINKEVDLKETTEVMRGILRSVESQSNYSNVEIICLVVESYSNVFSDKQQEPFKPAIDRVITGIDFKNCLINPQLTAVLLKQIIDGLQYFKNYIQPEKVLERLFFIFFHYNTALEYMGMLRENPQLSRKGQTIIEEFAKQSDEMKKRMKQLVVKAIIQVGNLSLQDFYNLIRKDILNLEQHMLYPCSIIDLIRNYIKSSQNNSIKHLPFLIEIILKSLDPNNPNLRKVCHRAATNALHTVCKMFQCVSFHQATQKIALGSFEHQIIIYDLRTAVKWRVLDGHDGQVTSLGFDNEGKHLCSFSMADSTLRVWKVGSTGFFGSILGIQGKHVKLFHVKKTNYDPSSKVTVQWNDQDNMIALKIGDQPTQQHKVW